MKRHRTLFLGCLICLWFLGIAGRAYVLQTVRTYSGSCSKLHGMPGILQKAGFLPSGNCLLDAITSNCKPETCQVNGKAGRCEKKQLDKNIAICVCVPQTPSR